MRLPPLPLVPLLCLAAGCFDAPTDASAPKDPPAAAPAASAPVPSERDLDRDVRDLITAVSPLSPTATALAQSDWYQRRKETLERLRRGSPELGAKALEAFHARPDGSNQVRGALLDVAAHCRPADTRPLLVELVTTFGEELELRKVAVRLLGETSPEVAAELLEPLVVETRHTTTYPPQDEMLTAWLTAMDELGRDPMPVLSDVATDPRQDDVTRSLAIRALGRGPSPRGRQALESILIESGGNHLTRRYAAQSLIATVPSEELCPVVERVFRNEADVGFQQFLASVIEEHCR